MSCDDLRKVAPGVFYSTVQPVTVGPAIVEFLKEVAAREPLRRARVCAHPDADASQHDMVIVSHRDTYVAPHRHRSKSETLLVVEGSAQVLLFDNSSGRPTRAFRVAPFGAGETFFYRMPEATFHSLVIESEYLVFVESTKGPFSADASEYAPWAPAPDQGESGRAYLRDVLAELDVQLGPGEG